MRIQLKTAISLTLSGLLLSTDLCASGPSVGREDSVRPIRFEEIGEKAGVRHLHRTRRFKGEHAEVLRMFTSGGAAAAVGDIDNDGWDDIFVTSSAQGAACRLFRNTGNLTFIDVTAKAGGFSNANDESSIVSDAAFFDYDNDGLQDLVIARFGTPLLFRNLGQGRFRDVSRSSGMSLHRNAIAVIAFDADGDGRLDLLFGNYFRPVNLLDLKDSRILPDNLDDARNGGGVTLYRNVGNGRFVDVTEESGLSDHSGWTLDVGHGDFDNDGNPDIYIAGDYGTDRVYFNKGDGVFQDRTQEALGGFDTKKGMNAEVADYDNDGFLDVYVTNITDEYMKECNMLWRNNGDGTFEDLSRETGTCDTLWGWGAKFGDFDNDGFQDLYAVNGLISAGEENFIPVLFEMIIRPGVDFSDLKSWPSIGNMTWSGYQKSKLFRNLDGEIFSEVAAQAGVDNDLDGRGVAIADFDRDGRLDIYVTNADQPALLYRNVSNESRNWVQLRLEGDPSRPFRGRRSSRDAIGARVTLMTDQGARMIREVQGGNGYSAQSTKTLHFGLGEAKIEWVEIRWPSGRVERVEVRSKSVNAVREGSGRAPAPPQSISGFESSAPMADRHP